MPAHLQVQKGSIVVLEAAPSLPISHEADVVILGSGVDGLLAPLAAAETAAGVLPIERGNCLCGTATAGMMTVFYTPYRCSHRIPRRIFDRVIAAGGAFPGEIISFDHEIFKSVAFEMAAEAGAASSPNDLRRRRDRGPPRPRARGREQGSAQCRPRTLAVRRERRCRHRGQIGGPADNRPRGRPQDAADDPAVSPWRHRRRDDARLYPPQSRRVLRRPEPDEARPREREHPHLRLLRAGGGGKRQDFLYPDCHYFRIEAVRPERGTALDNTVRIYEVDGTNVDHVTRAEIEARRQQRLLLAFDRAFPPGFASAYVLDSASHIGVRQTRRVLGGHILIEADNLAGARNEDRIRIDSNRQVPHGIRDSPDGKEGSIDHAENRRLAELVDLNVELDMFFRSWCSALDFTAAEPT